MPSRNTVQIEIRADDHASSTLHGVSGSLSSLGSHLGRIADFAIGGLLSAGLMNIGSAIGDIGRQAFAGAVELQKMSISLEGLIAKEIARGQEVTTSRQVVIHLTQQEQEKLKELRLEYDTMGAKLQEQKQRVWEMTNKWTEQGLATKTAKARLAEMQNQYDGLGKSIDSLAAKEGKLATVQNKTRVNTMELGQALKLAKPEAEKLLRQLRDLSVVSPFEYKDIITIFRLNMAFGQTKDMALRLTKAITDMASGMGLSGEFLERIAYNFSQMSVVGQITMRDIRDLAMAGIDLGDVLDSELGMSIDQINAKLKAGQMTMEDVSDAFVRYAEKNFGGAAERMSRTFSGLQSSIRDLVFFAGADLLTPLLEKVTSLLGGIFDKARKLVESGKLKEWGDQLGAAFDRIMEKLPVVAEALSPLLTAMKDLVAGNVESAMSAFAAGIGEVARHLLGIDPKVALDIAVAINQFGQAVIDAGQGLVGFAAAATDTVWQTTLDWFLVNGDALKDDLNGIADGFKNLGEKIGSAGESAKTAGPAVTGVLAGLTTVGLDQVAIALDLIATALPKVNSGLDELGQWTGANLGPVRDTNGELNLWGQNLAALQYQLLLLGSPMTKMQQDIQNWTALTTLLRDQIGRLAQEIKTVFGDAVRTSDTVVRAIEGTWTNLVNWANKVVSAMEEAGADIVAGIKRGISENWDAFIKWIEGKVGSIIDAIKAVFGIKSPAKATIPIGEALAMGILAGFNQAIGQVQSGIAAAAGNLTGIGAPAPAYAMVGGGAAGSPLAPGTLAVQGDTYYVTVTDRLAAAMLLSNVRDRQRRRLNVGMGG